MCRDLLASVSKRHRALHEQDQLHAAIIHATNQLRRNDNPGAGARDAAIDRYPRSNSSIASAMTRTFVTTVVRVPFREQRQNRLWDDQTIRYKRCYRGGSSQWTDGSS